MKEQELREEWKESEHSDGLSKEIRNDIADFWLSKREAELKEIKKEIEEMINSEIKFDEMNSEFMSAICKGSLKLVLAIIDEKLK